MSERNDKRLSSVLMGTLLAMHQAFFRKPDLALPISQFSVLMELHENGELSVRELSDILSMSKQQLSPIVAKLERFGYITRHPRATDRRFTDLALTEKGRGVIAGFYEQFRGRIETKIQNLSEAEFAELSERIQSLGNTLSPIMETPTESEGNGKEQRKGSRRHFSREREGNAAS